MKPGAPVRHFSKTSILFATLLLSAILSVIALPSHAALGAGDTAPVFKAQASLAGKSFPFSLQNLLAKGPVVVYFFPSAFTSGCNIQAHEFAVNYDKFAAADAAIIGISLDSIERLNIFSADPKYCAGKIPVASDAEGKIAKSYGLKVQESKGGIRDTRGIDIDHGFAERTTFILTPDGKIAAVVGGLAPEANVEKALKVVQQLAAEKRTEKP
jgi:peroxiredoxin